jgi:type II secretory pathway pseudopilin PulG
MIQFPEVMNRSRAQSERGYVLLALLLFVALLSIGVFVSIQRVEFQIRRDREEELIHRGVQYSRAVRKYFKAFGRYPTRIEDLENTNNQRFLRRRYKDPITGKDFKLLRMGDVQMSFGAPPGIPVSQMNNPQQGAPEAPDNDTQASSAAGPSAAEGESASPSSSPGAPSDASQTSQSAGSGSSVTPAPQQSASQSAGTSSSPQVFGGTGIVGVVSLSKARTIREFNKKNHYNQWQFIYDPTTDRGGLLMTPNQPPLMGTVGVNAPLNGTGTSSSSFGSSSPQQPQQPHDRQ